MKQLWEDLAPFLRIMAGHGGWLALGTFLGFLAVAASSGLLGLAGWFIIAAALAGLNPETAHLFNFFLPSVGVRFLAMARTAARYGERLFAHDAVFRLLQTLRLWFYRGVEPLAPACFTVYRRGDLLGRIIADIDLLDNLYLRMIAPGLIVVLLAALTGGVLGWFHGGIGALAGGALLVSALLLVLLAGKGGATLGRGLNTAVTELRNDLVEGLQGLAEVLIYQGARPFEAAIARRQAQMLALQAGLNRFNALALALATLAGGLTVTGVLYLGVALVGEGGLSGAVLGLMVLATLAAFEAVMPLPGAFRQLGQTRAAARRLLEITGQPPTVAFPRNKDNHAVAGDLEFRDVAFRYGSDELWVLEDVDFTIPQGTHLALFGPTGAGKSTLLNLLARFFDPARGAIFLGGRDLRELGEAQLRRSMAFVPQQPHFFNATLKANLTLACPAAGDDILWEALAQVLMADFVAGLPRGLDTWIGEGGQLISGGQARRLALVRAMLRDAPVWIADEPTEGLDPVTEVAVLEVLHQLTRNKTLIMVTHRPAGLAGMDRVLWLERGRIVADDTPARLREGFPPFTALFKRLD